MKLTTVGSAVRAGSAHHPEKAMHTILRCLAPVAAARRFGSDSTRPHRLRLGKVFGFWWPTGEIGDVAPDDGDTIAPSEDQYYAWCADCKRGTWYARVRSDAEDEAVKVPA